MSAEGTWQLRIRDNKKRSALHADSSEALTETNGRGAISDWVLHITDSHGNRRSFHMDLGAQIDTLPKYGNLFVKLTDTEREHLDRNRDGELDRAEADSYLMAHVRGFAAMDPPHQEAVRSTFLDDFLLHGGLRVMELEGMQRYLSKCYGEQKPPPSLLPTDATTTSA
jgi:hypothetical protein